jgi:hypothetical protein
VTWSSSRRDQTVIRSERTYDFVKVLDFGIAKIMVPDELVAETVQGAVFGTPEYMSPEAARGEDVDHRADVYSLGVILFDMLCGRPPFEASQSSDVLNMHINQPPPSPREFAPHREITEAAEKVILRAMQKDANKRYQTMADFRRDVENSYGTVSYRRHFGGAGGPPPIPTRGGEPVRGQAPSDQLERWMQADADAMRPAAPAGATAAKMVALVDQADRAFARRSCRRPRPSGSPTRSRSPSTTTTSRRDEARPAGTPRPAEPAPAKTGRPPRLC